MPGPGFHIRPADNGDVETLTGLIRAAYADVARRFGLTAANAPTHPSLMTADRLEASLNQGVRYFLAEVDHDPGGRPAGCVGLELAPDGVCYLERLAVLPEFRRTGLGSALIEHAAREALVLGASRLEIGLIAEQAELVAWYGRRGFVSTGTRKFDHLPFTVGFMGRDLAEGKPKAERRAMKFIDLDGRQMAYLDAGRGGPALFFVHGNSCDHSFFQPQIDHFSNRCRVVAVDLVGHGRSDKPETGYTYAGLARDCGRLCQELGLERMVVIGHSMGGAIGAEMAVAYPGLIAGLVALDASLIPDQARLEALLSPIIKDLEQADYLAAFRRFVDPLFQPGDLAEIRERVWRVMSRTPRPVMIALLAMFRDYPGIDLARISQPFLYVGGAAWRAEPGALLAARPGIQIEQVPESGHFLTLTAADQVNRLIDRFLDEAVAG